MKIALNTTAKKQQAKTEIAKNKDTMLDGSFLYNGELFYCDPTFQEAVKAYLLAYATGMIPPTQTVTIRKVDNSFWFPNQSELIPFAGTLFAHVSTIWAEYWSEKDAIE